MMCGCCNKASGVLTVRRRPFLDELGEEKVFSNEEWCKSCVIRHYKALEFVNSVIGAHFQLSPWPK